MPQCIQNRKTGVVHWLGINQCGDVTNHGHLDHWRIIGEFASLHEACQSDAAQHAEKPPRPGGNCLRNEQTNLNRGGR